MNKKRTTKFNDKIVLLFTLIIGYEWIMSGLSKLLSNTFVSGFRQQVSPSISNAYGIYQPILKHIVLPNASLFGFFIQYGELLVGAAFILIPILGLKKMSPVYAKIGMIASILAAFLSLNIFLFSGASFFDIADPFSQSVSLDLLLVFMQISLSAYFYKWNKPQEVEEQIEIEDREAV